MEKFSAYNIAFKGLAPGKHEYDFNIGRKFFELFEGGFVYEGDVNVKVILKKGHSLHTLQFKIGGTLKLTCDRCLEDYAQPIESETMVYLKFGNRQTSEPDDIIWLSPEEHQVNVAQLIYEFIVLNLPIKHVHPENKDGKSLCNSEMLEKLSRYVKKQVEPKPDDRWLELKKLINNN